MDYDIPESISQGSDGAQEAENRRIAEIADELSRLCRVHEAQLGAGEVDVSAYEFEQRAAEQMAKAKGYWIPMVEIFRLGVPGPCGHENDTYVAEQGIYKVNNLLNNNGSIVAVLRKIDTYMAALGFEKTSEEGRFTNGKYEAWDLLPRNVLVDKDGDIFVVDAEIKLL